LKTAELDHSVIHSVSFDRQRYT